MKKSKEMCSLWNNEQELLDEEAYQLLDSMTEKYLKSHPPNDSSSTMEIWKLREEAKRIAEEVIFQDIVNQFHLRGGILFMNENARIAENQNYFAGRTKQTETTTTPNTKGEERMRDYSMNGNLIIGCDHGYGNIKTAHFCFKASAEASETAPIFSKDYVKFEDKYYVIAEGHKSFLADKIADHEYYILTLVAIAKELEFRGLHGANINRLSI